MISKGDNFRLVEGEDAEASFAAWQATQRPPEPNPSEPRRVIPERARVIIEQCARDHEVSVADILGPSKTREHSEVRFDAIARIYALVRPCGNHVFTTTKIGQFMGRDHSTIVDALRRAEEIFGPTPKVLIGMGGMHGASSL